MKRILTAIVLVPLVVLTIFLGPYWLVNIVAAVVAMLAGWEFLSFASGASARPPRIATLIAIALLFVINYRWPEMLTSAVGVLSLALLVWCAFSSPRERVLGDAAYSVFCLLYTGLTMLALPLLYTSEDGKSTLLFLLCSESMGRMGTPRSRAAFVRISPAATMHSLLARPTGLPERMAA